VVQSFRLGTSPLNTASYKFAMIYGGHLILCAFNLCDVWIYFMIGSI
jgi:hypothetical protein